MKIFAAAVLSSVLSLAVPGVAPAAGSGLPESKYVALDGSTHSLAELEGHVAVVNFWATWCGPCREEMPRLQKLADEYSAKGVTFIAIALDDTETQPKIPGVVAQRAFRIPVWKGATADSLKELDLGVLVPATLILDDHGVVIGRIEGEARDKDVRTRLDWLLGGRQGKQPKVVQKNDKEEW
ncbi:thiol-disulfide isomerase/thioredoxin [Granulicella aggregans]|uniref:Thiol-disulfide isomerase/thioredoxin n=1 Tax=Granulicella aggregans TaxID=474949 RepID=A0A7W7ZG78_9BACT|nr:TlpA disulfide reductase family protein [Granulicella aggregans]MBB5059226.1 thiol-disulfide isomerase/thioredoxin [Granulicella aggregans]